MCGFFWRQAQSVHSYAENVHNGEFADELWDAQKHSVRLALGVTLPELFPYHYPLRCLWLQTISSAICETSFVQLVVNCLGFQLLTAHYIHCNSIVPTMALTVLTIQSIFLLLLVASTFVQKMTYTASHAFSYLSQSRNQPKLFIFHFDFCHFLLEQESKMFNNRLEKPESIKGSTQWKIGHITNSGCDEEGSFYSKDAFLVVSKYCNYTASGCSTNLNFCNTILQHLRAIFVRKVR